MGQYDTWLQLTLNRDYFISGLELFIEGHEDNDNELLIESQVLLNIWGEWYSANSEGIRKGKRF